MKTIWTSNGDTFEVSDTISPLHLLLCVVAECDGEYTEAEIFVSKEQAREIADKLIAMSEDEPAYWPIETAEGEIGGE